VTADQLVKRLEVVPFQRFEILLADQRSIPVSHPEVVSLEHGGRVAIVHGSNGDVEVTDLFFVVSLRFRESELISQADS
jgi:hypothetical protein